MQFIKGLICLVLLAGVMPAQSSKPNYWANDTKTESQVESLLKKMTLEEKIGQLVQYTAGVPTGPGTSRADYRTLASQGGLGSVFNLTGAAETNALQKVAVEQSRLHIPLIFGLDVIHGYRTIFPVPLGLAATWDPALVEQAARIAARESAAQGVRWTFSPMVDIARDARWGRIVEGAGEDPYLDSAMAVAYVRGYQGQHLSDKDSIAACTKHFVGYGAAEAGRDYNTAEIPDRLLRQVYLPPFQATIDAGSATFMSAFEALNEVPSTANPFTLRQVLKKEWNFRGFVVSDYGAIAELIPQGVAKDGATAARKAFLAGVDMDMESDLYGKQLPALVKSGQVPESTIDDAVRRILRVKFALGLFDHPYTENGNASSAPTQDDLVAARTAAEESFVLLKNGEGPGQTSVLPLAANTRTIALIGPLADDAAQMLGSWAAKGEAGDAVTLRAALGKRLEDNHGKLLYAKGTDITGTSDAGFAEAVSAAKQADVVVMALGEDANWMTGEAASRAHLDLPGNQESLLEAIAATGKPVVLLVFSGRPIILNWAAQHVGAIVEVWFPGIQAGPALARVLFGDAIPGGRLDVSFPRAVGQEPLYYNALNTGRPAGDVDETRMPRNPQEKYRSRYIDEMNSPLFPFGFGLSYTTFDYSQTSLSAQSVSAKSLNAGDKIRVTAEVRNSGHRAADDVVQLYIRETGTSVARPVRELKGFQRITLQPGASKQVEFMLGRDELKFWNIDMQDIVEPSEVTVWVAPDSTRGTPAQFHITQ